MEDGKQRKRKGKRKAKRSSSVLAASGTKRAKTTPRPSTAPTAAPFPYRVEPALGKGGGDGLAGFAALSESSSPSEVFRWLVAPMTPREFFSVYWEKQPLLIRRTAVPGYNDSLLSSKTLYAILREHYVKYTVNLDITQYVDGERQTLNPEGRAHAISVREFFKSGCSVRMLNPQTFHPPVWRVLSALQEYFGCMAGANTYLTPAASQGFSPHYDDIELEGKKRWRLYLPPGESLPKHSSANFAQDEIGECVFEVVLEAGDMLYFPRGFVHQAEALEEDHSFHITISTYQNNSWAQFLHTALPRAIDVAFAADERFRKGLPLRYLEYMGHEGAQKDGDAVCQRRRESFQSHFRKLVPLLAQFAPMDKAADEMGARYLHDCMPPALSSQELAASVKGAPLEFSDSITLDSKVRAIRPYAARLVVEGPAAIVHHCMDNGMFYHGEEKQSLEFPVEMAGAIGQMLSAQAFTRVSSIRGLEDEELFQLVVSLFEAGLILVEH